MLLLVYCFCCVAVAAAGGGGGGGSGVSLGNYKIYLNTRLQYENNKHENCALLVIMLRVVVISYRRFGTTYLSRLSRNLGKKLPPLAAS
jgi:hypothetical protein